MTPRAFGSLITAFIALAGVGIVAAPVAQAADTNCPISAAYPGTGTSGDPFLISTPGQLQRLRDTSADWNDTVKLSSDIDMSSGGTDCVWATTIGDANPSSWTGTFDGGGHVVSGLDISVTSGFAGFIGYLGSGGAIRDLGFTGDVTATFTRAGSASPGVGGLVGWTLQSTIDRSFATGNVTVTSTATASGDSATSSPYVGGLVGNLQATLSDSYATGNVSVTAVATATGTGTATVYTRVGGLAGSMESGASIVQRSYATGTATSSASATGGGNQSTTQNVGGVVGSFDTQYAGATATVWDTTSSSLANGIGLGSSANITGRTSSQMQAYGTFTTLGWGVANGYSAGSVWNMCPAANSGRPVLSAFMTESTCYFPARTPTFSTPVSSADGFTVAVTNYDDSWAWVPSTSAGSVTVGTAVGAALPITVSGLRPNESATLTMAATRTGYSTGSGTAVGQALPPPPPVPASAPRDVRAVAGDSSASVSWAAPASSGSFPISTYQVTSSPGGRSCLAATPALTCDVAGLANGTTYTFTVKALTGAGWSAPSEPSNAVTPRAVARPSIVITGSRAGERIEIAGKTTGFGMGGSLRPWQRFPGQSAYSEGAATILVSRDGTFEWGRRTGKRVSVYVQTPDESVRSNTVTIR